MSDSDITDGPARVFEAPKKDEPDAAVELNPILWNAVSDSRFDFRPVPVDANLPDAEEEEEEAPKAPEKLSQNSSSDPNPGPSEPLVDNLEKTETSSSPTESKIQKMQ
jgi:hypothetical protein